MAEKKTQPENETAKAKQELAFSKAAILGFQKYAGRRDLLSVLLEEKDYTLAEVDRLVDGFMKGGKK